MYKKGFKFFLEYINNTQKYIIICCLFKLKLIANIRLKLTEGRTHSNGSPE